MSEPRCVNAHDLCHGGTSAPCPYCERTPAPVAKHTPAPWIAEQIEDGDEDGGFNGRLLYTGEFFKPVDDETVEYINLSRPANARLIAAAPDMYEALCRVLELFGVTHEHLYAIEQARAAIDKAEGTP